MIKLKDILNEVQSEQELKDKLAQNRKKHHELLAKMYGPNGTEQRMSKEKVKSIFSGVSSPGSLNMNVTSPEFEAIKKENDKIRGEMGKLSDENQKYYEELEKMGKKDFVEKWREEGMETVTKLIQGLTDNTLKKIKDDSTAETELMKEKQRQYTEALRAEFDKRAKKYEQELEAWLNKGQQGDEPKPPSIDDITKELGKWEDWKVDPSKKSQSKPEKQSTEPKSQSSISSKKDTTTTKQSQAPKSTNTGGNQGTTTTKQSQAPKQSSGSVNQTTGTKKEQAIIKDTKIFKDKYERTMLARKLNSKYKGEEFFGDQPWVKEGLVPARIEKISLGGRDDSGRSSLFIFTKGPSESSVMHFLVWVDPQKFGKDVSKIGRLEMDGLSKANIIPTERDFELFAEILNEFLPTVKPTKIDVTFNDGGEIHTLVSADKKLRSIIKSKYGRNIKKTSNLTGDEDKYKTKKYRYKKPSMFKRFMQWVQS